MKLLHALEQSSVRTLWERDDGPYIDNDLSKLMVMGPWVQTKYAMERSCEIVTEPDEIEAAIAKLTNQ